MKLVNVDVGKVDEIWRRDKNFHIPPSEPGVNFKYDRAKNFISGLEPGDSFEAPALGVNEAGPALLKSGLGGWLGFDDGRHRFAAMRDMGMKSAPVSMDPTSIVNARKAGLLTGSPVINPKKKAVLSPVSLSPVSVDPFAQ